MADIVTQCTIVLYFNTEDRHQKFCYCMSSGGGKPEQFSAFGREIPC